MIVLEPSTECRDSFSVKTFKVTSYTDFVEQVCSQNLNGYLSRGATDAKAIELGPISRHSAHRHRIFPPPIRLACAVGFGEWRAP